eukprot:358313-Chlamydomonas_euryale.AAC.2
MQTRCQAIEVPAGTSIVVALAVQWHVRDCFAMVGPLHPFSLGHEGGVQDETRPCSCVAQTCCCDCTGLHEEEEGRGNVCCRERSWA